jgi:branched-chain amino acid transport system ATP-binding protein
VSGAGETLSERPLLAVTDLTAGYGAAQALFGITFSLQRGESLALLGPNGAGKSTTARCISGLVPPLGGKIEFDGVDITKISAHKARKLGIGYLPEGRGIFPGLTVWENLRMATRWLDGGRAARLEAIQRVVEMFPILAERAKQKAGSLSGGEQQMLSVASGLAVRPRLLIADELSLGLAPLVVDHLMEVLTKTRDEGTTVLLIEQYIHRALSFSDHCAILRRGTVSWAGLASEAEETVLQHYLGDTVEEDLISPQL